jgi:hypothetical protein
MRDHAAVARTGTKRHAGEPSGKIGIAKGRGCFGT